MLKYFFFLRGTFSLIENTVKDISDTHCGIEPDSNADYNPNQVF